MASELEKNIISTYRTNADASNESTHKVLTDRHESKVNIVEVTQSSPYLQLNFIGTYLAICLGTLSSYGGFVMPATSLSLINDDIGPSSNITWVALAWTLCLSVGYTLVGRLSDIFGRRWFFISATLLATIGCIIGATAKTVNQLISANVFIGLAAAAQLSFNYTIGELVPVKHRFISLAFLFLFAVPFSGFGPYISRLFIANTSGGWRWDYYLNIIINGLSALLYFLFYHPPTFDDLHRDRRSRWQEVKDLDYIGIFLFVVGLSLFLIGLSWGGSQYAWKSAHVISTLVLGFVISTIFVFYECFAPLRRPLIPMHLFKNGEYCVLTIITTVGGMLYYSLNVIYPIMIASIFTTDIVKAGLLSCAVGGGVGLGQFLASILATPGGYIRWKLIFSTASCAAFTAGLAGAKNQAAASALATLASVFIGALESLAGPLVTIVVCDQSELGAAVGVFGSIRSIGGVLATTIFTTILTNKVTENTKSIVIPNLTKSGLPISSVEPFLAAFNSGNITAAEMVPGTTQEIIKVATTSLQTAYAKSFTIVYLVSLAFGLSAVIASLWAPKVEERLTHNVIRQLTTRGHT